MYAALDVIPFTFLCKSSPLLAGATLQFKKDVNETQNTHTSEHFYGSGNGYWLLFKLSCEL